RVTKRVATAELAGRPAQSYLAGTFHLEYAENPGAFLSFGGRLPRQARFALLVGAVSITLAALAYFALSQKWSGFALMGASLTFAGGLSNVVDRFARGTVVDFMSVGVGRWTTGIFNVADIAIMCGCILILIGQTTGLDHRREMTAHRSPE